MKTKQKRAGRVLSAANESKLSDALGALEGAVGSIRSVFEPVGG
ncbi:MAG TPA: hypothetical protein PKA43_00125 [Candidatus Competibacter phosphatis]|nr:hypothetical protein [Candidatus Competibacter phosphatis]